MSSSDIQTAERLVRRRARMLIVLAILFMATQGGSFRYGAQPGETLRASGLIHISAWLVMAAALMILLLTGGGLLRRKAVRQLINDESTSENRRKALSIGFVNAMLTGFLLYFLSFYELFSGREAAHVIMTVGIASALLAFGVAERRALKDA